jgi:aminoglycoside phosphotransferase (APT) family kinase protein
MTDTAEHISRLEAFFQRRSDDPDSLKVVDYEVITGGYSRAMSKVFVEDSSGRRGYIIRADPPPGQAIIDTDRATEWSVLSTLYASGQVPMPVPRWFDPTDEELGSPAIVIDLVDGEAMVSLTRKVADEDHPEWGRRLAEVMATVHLTDMAVLPPELEVPDSWDEYIDARIQYWEDSERAHIDRDPIMRYVAAWLRANRPPPVPLGLVHGDLQIANVLIDRDDTCLVIDWELTHVGDPREDIGWSLLAGVTQPPDLIRCDEESFYARYRELTGFTEEQVNAAVMDFFLLLASPTVYVSVIEQLAALARGETTGIAVAYMSPAVIGMHDVFMRAIAHHKSITGGAA